MTRHLLAAILAIALTACAPPEEQTSQQPPPQQADTAPANVETKPAEFTGEAPAPGAEKAHMVSLNSSSHKFHEAGCRYYDCQNCVTVSYEEALQQGGVPCKKCH